MMFQRTFLSLLLFFIFVFTQIGAVTHEISHLEISHLGELSHHTQQSSHSNPEKNTTKHQCGQCIASAQAVSGLPSLPLVVYLSQAKFQLSTPQVAYLASVLIAPYSARAPPLALNS